MTAFAHEEAAVAGAQGCYLYAIIDGVGDRQALGLTGLDGADIYTLADGEVAAVVSDLPARRVRPERRRLAAHHEVLKRLMDGHTLLPMSFGLIAESGDAVRRILRLNRDELAGQLGRIRGKVEMGVRVAWDVPNIFEMIVTLHPDLRALRDHMFRGGRVPSHDEKIELGRQFDRLLAADRERCAQNVINVLSSYCADIVTNKLRDEHEVMNLACLVDRGRLTDFEHGVCEAASLFDERFTFDFNGPWPPHNFAGVELRTS